MTEKTSAQGPPLSLRCSFCNEGPGGGRQFVSGPGVYICDECVRRAADILNCSDEPPPPSIGYDGAPDSH